ncbi:MAG: hypothetical protein NTW87_09400 [Planctomycetota bacterium]|nr:hypothetical protein [Planctomycetota bacterium]
MHPNPSISGLPVVFKRIIKTHESDTTKRIHYKVLAEVSTKAGTKEQAYWFSAGRSFLRQRDQTTGKTSLKVGYSSRQRAQIRELVKSFKATAAEA